MGLRPRTGCFVNISPKNYIDISVTLSIHIHPGRCPSIRLIIVDVSINISMIIGTSNIQVYLGLCPRTGCNCEYFSQQVSRYFDNHKYTDPSGAKPLYKIYHYDVSINISMIIGTSNIQVYLGAISKII